MTKEKLKFHRGQQVKTNHPDLAFNLRVGMIFRVDKDAHIFPYWVQFDGVPGIFLYKEDELEAA